MLSLENQVFPLENRVFSMETHSEGIVFPLKTVVVPLSSSYFPLKTSILREIALFPFENSRCPLEQQLFSPDNQHFPLES